MLSDFEIRRYLDEGRLTIQPFAEAQIQPNGVDLSIGKEYQRLDAEDSSTKPIPKSGLIVKPGERILLSTLEMIEMPNDLVGTVNLRSSYSRLGVAIPPTVIDSAFEGNLTLLLIGGAKRIRLKEGDRVWYVMFMKCKPPRKSYSGKYQRSKGLVEHKRDR